MSKPIRFAAAAREEFLAGVERYGTRFRSAVNAATRSIGRFPKAWGAYPGHAGTRRVVLKRYPFVLVTTSAARPSRSLSRTARIAT